MESRGPRKFIAAFLFVSFLSAQFGIASYANETYEYPELVVTPRASDRLALEAKEEEGRTFTTHLPVQISGMMTFLSAALLSEEDMKNTTQTTTKTFAMGIGLGWVVAGTVLGLTYKPYANGVRDTKDLPRGSKREQLTRERMSEEAINSAASLGRKLTWLSFATNLGGSALMMINSKSATLPLYFSLGSMVASALPLLFPYRWITVANEQENYKKKIYAPIASLDFVPEPGLSGRFVPAMTLSYRF